MIDAGRKLLIPHVRSRHVPRPDNPSVSWRTNVREEISWVQDDDHIGPHSTGDVQGPTLSAWKCLWESYDVNLSVEHPILSKCFVASPDLDTSHCPPHSTFLSRNTPQRPAYSRCAEPRRYLAPSPRTLRHTSDRSGRLRPPAQIRQTCGPGLVFQHWTEVALAGTSPHPHA